jgi:hypothetical protein
MTGWLPWKIEALKSSDSEWGYETGRESRPSEDSDLTDTKETVASN